MKIESSNGLGWLIISFTSEEAQCILPTFKLRVLMFLEKELHKNLNYQDLKFGSDGPNRIIVTNYLPSPQENKRSESSGNAQESL